MFENMLLLVKRFRFLTAALILLRLNYEYDMKRFQSTRNAVIIWAYDEPPDATRFVKSLANFPSNTGLRIYCGSTECMDRAERVAQDRCVRILRLNVMEMAQGTPLQTWVEHHVLAKLLAVHYYEDHLQIAMQLSAVWKYGGVLFQAGSLMPNLHLSVGRKIEFVRMCENSLDSMGESIGGLYSLTAPRNSVMVEKMIEAFLDTFSWRKPINFRYDPSNWPIKVKTKMFMLKGIKSELMSCPTHAFSDGRDSSKFFGTLSYDERRKYLVEVLNNTGMNVGDETQGLAGIQMLPRVDAFVERDRLDIIKFTDGRDHSSGKVYIFLNAWWGTRSMTWPPPERLEPIAVAMHFQKQVQPKILQQDVSRTNDPPAPYLKSKSPIGARDTKTLAFLRSNGVYAIFSACMTMTLSIPRIHRDGSVLIVDAGPEDVVSEVVPHHILQNAQYLTQKLKGREAESNMIRYTLAYERLTLYARAKLVITGRLHVGLPAVALGTPVIFIHGKHLPGGGGNRLDGLDDFMHTVKGDQRLPANFNWTNPPMNPKQDDFQKYLRRIKQLATCNAGISDSSRKFGMMPRNWDVGTEREACTPNKDASGYEPVVQIATTLDVNFYDHVFPSWIKSLARSNLHKSIVLYILTVDLTEKQRCLLRLVVHKLMPHATVYTIPVELGVFKPNYNNPNYHVSIATQSSLRLPSLLQCVDKILWIDLDAFVVGNLRKIYDQQVAPCGINARSSIIDYMSPIVGDEWVRNYGNSFNAGVMLLNLQALREARFEQSVVEHWAVQLAFNDQVTFNMACNGTHGRLDPEMNLYQLADKGSVMRDIQMRDQNLMQNKTNWIIVHFQGDYKPWQISYDAYDGGLALKEIWEESKMSLEDVLDLRTGLA